MPKGTYVELDIASVKANAQKTVTYLTKKIPQISRRRLTVVFLGEEHRNAVDEEVTQAMLAGPPIVKPGMRVIFERLLDNVYIAGAAFGSERTEAINLALGRQARSTVIAAMIQDAFDNGIELVYVACGSAHAVEIFNSMDKRCTESFTFVVKLSSTD
jgi:hypothetical protein